MTDTVSQIVKSAPDLVLMFLFVIVFLRAMAARDKLFTATIKNVSDEHRLAMQDISRQHLEAREQQRKAIEDNTKHTVEATLALHEMSKAVTIQCQQEKNAAR